MALFLLRLTSNIYLLTYLDNFLSCVYLKPIMLHPCHYIKNTFKHFVDTFKKNRVPSYNSLPRFNEIRPISEHGFGQQFLGSRVGRPERIDPAVRQRGTEDINQIVAVHVSGPVGMRFRSGRMSESEYISGDRKYGMIPRQFDSWRHVLAVAEQLDHVVSGHVLVTWSLPIAVVIGDYVVQLLLVVRVNVLHEGSKNPGASERPVFHRPDPAAKNKAGPRSSCSRAGVGSRRTGRPSWRPSGCGRRL